MTAAPPDDKKPPLALNLFSNVAARDPARNLAAQAARSVLAALRVAHSHRPILRLFCDPNPNPDRFEPWCEAARAALAPLPLEIHRTSGLADGWLRALALAEGDHAMMMEHDFVLLPRRIRHSLAEITAAMARGGVTHLRFNKRANRARGYDAFMVPDPLPGIPCCRVPGRSNNPHLIDVAHARALVAPWVDRTATKAAGLEGRLERFAGGGHVYGGPGHPATAGHLDGRGARLSHVLARPLTRFRARKAA